MSRLFAFLDVGLGFRFFLLVALAAAGCSKGADGPPGTVPVTGKATYNGQPLADATVSFISDGADTPGAALTGSDGTYTLRVKPGSYTATVSKAGEAGAGNVNSMEEAMANVGNAPQQPTETLPAKYQSPTDSPLKFQVSEKGPNQYDLQLSDSP